jgi:hypothetical protein
MATIDDLFSEVRPLTMSVPVVTLRRAIRSTVKRFCQESMAWKHTIEGFAFSPGNRIQDISASLPTTTGIFALPEDPTYVSDGGKILRSSVSELNRSVPKWRNLPSARPKYCFLESPTTLSFVAPPSEADTIDLRVVCMPLLGSDYIADDILENYFDALTFGSIAIALNNPISPQYDPSLIHGYTNLFNQAVESAKAHSLQEKTLLSAAMSYGGI